MSKFEFAAGIKDTRGTGMAEPERVEHREQHEHAVCALHFAAMRRAYAEQPRERGGPRAAAWWLLTESELAQRLAALRDMPEVRST